MIIVFCLRYRNSLLLVSLSLLQLPLLLPYFILYTGFGFSHGSWCLLWLLSLPREKPKVLIIASKGFRPSVTSDLISLYFLLFSLPSGHADLGQTCFCLRAFLLDVASSWIVFPYKYDIFFFFGCTVQHVDHSSPTSDWTHAPCSGSMES